MVKDEWDPIRAGLPAAAAVDAPPEELGHDGHDHREHDEAQDEDPPAIVIVQDQLHAGRDVRSHIKDEEKHEAECEEGVAGGHLASNYFCFVKRSRAPRFWDDLRQTFARHTRH